MRGSATPGTTGGAAAAGGAWTPPLVDVEGAPGAAGPPDPGVDSRLEPELDAPGRPGGLTDSFRTSLAGSFDQCGCVIHVAGVATGSTAGVSGPHVGDVVGCAGSAGWFGGNCDVVAVGDALGRGVELGRGVAVGDGEAGRGADAVGEGAAAGEGEVVAVDVGDAEGVGVVDGVHVGIGQGHGPA